MGHEGVGVHEGDELVQQVGLALEKFGRQLLHHLLQVLGREGRHAVPRFGLAPIKKKGGRGTPKASVTPYCILGWPPGSSSTLKAAFGVLGSAFGLPPAPYRVVGSNLGVSSTPKASSGPIPYAGRASKGEPAPQKCTPTSSACPCGVKSNHKSLFLPHPTFWDGPYGVNSTPKT